MNLEGTKHEKAVLVVIAYIIGFTSCFIAFGVSSMGQTESVVSVAPSVLTTPDGAPYIPPSGNPPDTEEPAESSEETVSYEEGKLYANVGAERFVLSLRSDIMPNDNVEGFATQGVHENLPAYSASADGRFVYFCEQQTDTEECTNFVFDTQASVIQFVAVDGKKLITPNSEAETASWSGDTLIIGSFSSASVDTPWKMVLGN